MTENDYSIKPLPNLPNVAGLNPAKGSEGRQKRQNPRKKTEEVDREVSSGPELEELDDKHETEQHHIDYCA